MKAIEDWATQKQTEDWQMAAIKQRMRWGIGKEVSEGDFDEALNNVLGIKLSGYADQQKLNAQAQREAEEAKAQREARAQEDARSKTMEQQLAEAPAPNPQKEG